jgi:glycosyltransferase involved in cell wall biosynthesis
MSKLKLAYIGSIVPDIPPYINRAFSRAGNMCQISLLKGLIRAKTCPSIILSLRPVVSFPKSRQILYQPISTLLEEGITLTFLPFINITPIKQLLVGISTLYYLLRWGYRNQDTSHHNIIYTFNISVPPGIFTLLAARLTGAKVVAMIYDIFVPGETSPDSIFGRIDYWLHKKSLPLFDGLVVITNAIAHDFAPRVPYLLIEGGISHDLITQYQALTAVLHKDKDCFTVVVTGKLDEVNGIHLILEAISLVKDTRFRLHIAGAGPLENIIKEAAGKDNRIIFHGFLSYDDVLKLYAAADLLVNMRLTQRINTRYFFPSKTMEYLASGVPVITTCPGNMTDEYGDLAYLLHDETAEALADMMIFVAAVPEVQRRDLGRSAQCYMAEHKTWDSQAVKIAQFLELIAIGRNHNDL